MQFTDRYQALGIPYPEAATVCLGHCEGTGMVPVYAEGPGVRVGRKLLRFTTDEQDERLVAAWHRSHDNACGWRGWFRHLWRAVTQLDRIYARMLVDGCDGWHFVTCPDCAGTGKRAK